MRRLLPKVFLISFFIALILVLGVYLFSSRTVDFAGTITEITADGDVVRLLINNSDMAIYAVYANQSTKVSFCCSDDPKISLSEIAIGDVVTGSFNRVFHKKFAQWIEVEFHH